MAFIDFNANEVEPNKYELVPDGDYTCIITESEWKPTRDGSGKILALTFQIVEGEHAGRSIWVNLNMENPNQMAVKIARGDLSSICRAVNVMTPRDTCELHNLPLVLKVRCIKDKNTGELKNAVRGYMSCAEYKAQRPVQPAASNSQVAPWKR